MGFSFEDIDNFNFSDPFGVTGGGGDSNTTKVDVEVVPTQETLFSPEINIIVPTDSLAKAISFVGEINAEQLNNVNSGFEKSKLLTMDAAKSSNIILLTIGAGIIILFMALQ